LKKKKVWLSQLLFGKTSYKLKMEPIFPNEISINENEINVDEMLERSKTLLSS